MAVAKQAARHVRGVSIISPEFDVLRTTAKTNMFEIRIQTKRGNVCYLHSEAQERIILK